MIVEDVANSVYTGLRALDRRRYLCAMWILCGELRELYADYLTDADRSLMASTLDVVREITMAGEKTADAAQKMAGLYQKWILMVIDESREAAEVEHWNTRVVFRDLTFESTEDGRNFPYDAAERVDLAVTDRWDLPGSGYVEGPDVEIDDYHPMARTLNLFNRVVTGVTEMTETEMWEAGWDPLKIRQQLVG